MFIVLDLFSGIGGFSLGLEQTNGFKTIAFCEIDEFCRSVLTKHWENVPIFDDITKITEQDILQLGNIDVICGGFPCQPISTCGKRKGEYDERWMWPEFYRIICMVKPKYVLVENVVGLLSIQSGRLFGGILRDLAQIGYDAEWQVLSASQFNLPHVRKRLFLVAYSVRERMDKVILQKRIDTKSTKTEWSNSNFIYMPTTKRSYPNVSDIIRENYGISEELDKHIIQKRIKSLGNAIVPACAQFIGQCLLNANQNL